MQGFNPSCPFHHGQWPPARSQSWVGPRRLPARRATDAVGLSTWSSIGPCDMQVASADTRWMSMAGLCGLSTARAVDGQHLWYSSDGKNGKNGSYGGWRQHLTGRLSLVSDQRLRRRAQRTKLNNYGSERWGFESLRTRKMRLTPFSGPRLTTIWRGVGVSVVVRTRPA